MRGVISHRPRPLALGLIAALAMALRRMALHARSDFSESALAR